MATVKELLLERLPRTEGVRLKPYKDTEGKWTVGVGHNVADNGLPGYAVVELIENNGVLSDNSVNRLLGEDLVKVFKDVQAIPCYAPLNVIRQSVLADMVFNMGLGKVLAFSKMLYALSRNDFVTAAKEMLDSKWAKQVGDRAKELANLMERG